MPTYYTDNVLGNDANLGTTPGAGNAWKTIEKGLATLVSGDTLMIASGTYPEDSAGSGQLKLRGQGITLQGTSGVAADVIIKGLNHATTSIAQTASITGSTFKNVTFSAQGTQVNTLNLLCAQQSTNVLFTNCAVIANNVTGAFGVIFTSSAATTNSYTFTNCSFTKVNATGTSGNPFACTVSATDNMTLVMNNCTGSAASGQTIWLDGGGSGTFTVNGGTFTGSAPSNSCFLFGRDSGVGLGCHGSITGATVIATGDHALEFGDHSTCVGTGNIVVGQNYGMVFKNAQSCIFTGNTVTNNTANAAVLLKGGTGNIVAGNTLISSAGPCVKNWDSGGGPVPADAFCNYSCQVKNNRLILTGTASYMDWQQLNGNGDPVDGGGNVVDFNNIYYNGIAQNFGTVNGVTPLTTLTALRGAWNTVVIDTGFDLNTVVSTSATTTTTVMALPYTATGAVLYTTIVNNYGLYWNNSTSAFEVFTPAHWPLYGILTTEYPLGSYYYSATVPVNLPRGSYWYTTFLQTSYFAQVFDTPIRIRERLNWSGIFRFMDDFPARKNTVLNNFTFEMFDLAGASAPGMTVSALRSIARGAYTPCDNPVGSVGGGTYAINFSAADFAGDVVQVKFTAVGCRDTVVTFILQS